jgi:uncharacterized delta-60 repeat protein
LARYGLDGQLDTSFGYQGVVADPYGISGATNSIAVQKNKDILNAGSEAGPTSGSISAAAMVRYHTNGTLDTTFGQAGRATFAIGNDAAFTDIVVAKSGSIYAAATGEDANGDPVYALYGLKSNGSLNFRFGSAGTLNEDGPISGLAELADGDVVFDSTSSTTGELTVSCDLPNGRPDNHFGTGGDVSLGILQAQGGLLVEPDGDLLIGTNGGILELSSKGVLNSGFGNDGSASALSLTAMALGPRGTIVAISGSQFSVTRFLATGTLDTTFGTDGTLSLANTGLGITALQSVAIEASGEIIAGIVVDSPSVETAALAITPAGAIDANFAQYSDSETRGISYLLEGNGIADSVSDIVIQNDGNILISTNAPDNGLDVPSGLFRLLGS